MPENYKSANKTILNSEEPKTYLQAWKKFRMKRIIILTIRITKKLKIS